MADRYVMSKTYGGKYKVLGEYGNALWVLQVDEDRDTDYDVPFTIKAEFMEDFKPEPPVKPGDILTQRLREGTQYEAQYEVQVMVVGDDWFRFFYVRHLTRDVSSILTYTEALTKIGPGRTFVRKDSDE